MWEDFELDADSIPTIKLVLHSLQILCAFIGWCLEIAVFRNKEAKIVGNNGWTFAVFFLTIPAWIYLIGTPRYERARKLAEPRVMVTVDAIFIIIWLSAFATQAAYNTANLCGTACGASKAVVAMAVFVCLLFCASTFVSIWTLKRYQWDGRLPGYDREPTTTHNADPDKAAFSLAPHDEEAYAPVNMHDEDDRHDAATEYGGARSDYSDPYRTGGGAAATTNYAANASTVSSYHDNPFRSQEQNPFDNTDTAYHSGTVSSAVGGRYTHSPSPQPFDDARFPAANYDRIGPA
ncbi:hypothetical protein VTJ83DRAFT_5836 [Remersonia thermophila]|uniref:MARVEL domain-containing protein n=1 Tax=Remersonia thermophila TaxID=72144 RepID=A0ABR4D7Z1_9PEZI